ncbi:SPOSA6832_02648 [Sporobolomyces salmonicolor]|uniref:SPOSA6832_02648-mRNA-1:cds n=1 Tax=Sporidiobolus salmonicolor TaxID=5005 RepID=A0A0D6ELR6_SPOSA|nr:SPOSA6832_02648 [Sporobolomyces salmonicolor]
MALASYVGQETLTAACPNGGALLDLCSRFTHNSFALTSSTDMTNIGVSISPLTALFNHSCSPNAVVVFPSFPSSSWPKHMRVVTLKPISPGEEVLTSYVDIALPRELRRKELKDRYKFDCDCVECTGKVREGKVDPREALSCPTAGCEGLIARPATTLQDSSAALQAAKVALGDAEKAQYDDPRTALIHLSHLISSLTSISPPFAPSSYPLLHAYQLQLTLQLHAHDFPSALQSAHFAWQGATLIYPFGHPVRAVLSTTVARLAVMAPSSESSSPEADLAYWSNLGQRARGVAMLVEALKEVEVAFGKVEGGGEMGKAVRELLRDQEEGMAMARKVGRAMRGV